MWQINDDDLETCEQAIAALEGTPHNADQDDHFQMLKAAINRVRNDYGPHTQVRIIEA